LTAKLTIKISFLTAPFKRCDTTIAKNLGRTDAGDIPCGEDEVQRVTTTCQVYEDESQTQKTSSPNSTRRHAWPTHPEQRQRPPRSARSRRLQEQRNRRLL